MHALIVTGYSRNLFKAGIAEFERRAHHGGWKTSRMELDDFLARPLDWAEYDDLAIAGGDGTVRACLRLKPSVPIVVVPTGTGNDFARSLGIHSIGDSARLLCAGSRRRIDLARITYKDAVGQNHSEFVANGIGLGLDGYIARQAARKGSYRSAVLRAVCRLPSLRYRARLEIDALPAIETEFLSLLVANGTYFGGGFRLSPRSLLDDGVLDVIEIKPVTRMKYLRSVSKARTGAHVRESEVVSRVGRSIRIIAESPLPCHLDGECRDLCTAEIRVLKQELTFYAE